MPIKNFVTFLLMISILIINFSIFAGSEKNDSKNILDELKKTYALTCENKSDQHVELYANDVLAFNMLGRLSPHGFSGSFPYEDANASEWLNMIGPVHAIQIVYYEKQKDGSSVTHSKTTFFKPAITLQGHFTITTTFDVIKK